MTKESPYRIVKRSDDPEYEKQARPSFISFSLPHSTRTTSIYAQHLSCRIAHIVLSVKPPSLLSPPLITLTHHHHNVTKSLYHQYPQRQSIHHHRHRQRSPHHTSAIRQNPPKKNYHVYIILSGCQHSLTSPYPRHDSFPSL